jgi:ferritin
MLSKKIEEALNEQINAELYSAYLYLAMAAYFESMNLHGFAHWMKGQTMEEYNHAMKMFDFLNQCGNRVVLKSISEPPVAWESPLAVFEATYKHEQAVTGRIGILVNLAITEKEHAAANFLQWFVKEQVEEEASAADIVQKLKMTADSATGLMFIDSELGKRAAS